MPRHEITPEQEATEREKAHRGTRVRRLVYVLVVVAAWLAIGGVGGPTVGRLSRGPAERQHRVPAPDGGVHDGVPAVGAVQPEHLAALLRGGRARRAGSPARTGRRCRASSRGCRTCGSPSAARRSGPTSRSRPPPRSPARTARRCSSRSSSTPTRPTRSWAAPRCCSRVRPPCARRPRTTLAPSGLKVYVTGPGGTLADFVTAFGGIDGILLGVALGVVFLILLIVYRSPILPFAVLLTAVFGLAAAALVIFPLAKNGTIGLNGQSQGILSILVVGAATDYALLLVARYREELHDHPSKWAAMRVAWRAAVEPIGASAATVILGLLCLLLSQLRQHPRPRPGRRHRHRRRGRRRAHLPARRPAALRPPASSGRIVPRVDHVHAEDAVGTRGVWGRVAGLVGRHPRRTWVVTLLALLVLGGFVPTFRAEGDHPVPAVPQQGRVGHRPGGARPPLPGRLRQPGPDRRRPRARPTQVVATRDARTRTSPRPPSPPAGPACPGRRRRSSTARSWSRPPCARPPTARRPRTPSPGCAASSTRSARTCWSAAARPSNLDVRLASERDLRVIIPAILLVIFLVLMLLLRSVVAPLLLVPANVVSFAATLGVSALVFNHVFDFPGSDPSTPLYAFVFLVALGIDYSIFLMTRVREESVTRTTRPGILVGAGRHRRGDHQRGHRAGGDVLGPGDDPDPVPGADRVHRRVRRAARHPGGALACSCRRWPTTSARRIWWPSLLAGTAGPARAHRRTGPHGLGSRAWSPSGSQVSPPPGRASTRRSSQPRACTLAAIATAQPRAGRAGPCGLPRRRDRPRPRRACWRVDGLDLVVLATPERAARRPGARGDRCRPAGRRRQAAGHRPPVRRWPSWTPRGRRASPLTVFQNRRYDAEHVTMRDVVRSRTARRGVPGRDAVGTLAARAQGPLARERAADRGRRHHARPADPRRRRRGRPVRAGRDRLRARSSAAPRRPRTTRSWPAGTSPARSATSAPPRWRRRPGPASGCSAGRAAFVLNAFERDLDIYPDLRTDDDHCGWIYAATERTPAPRSDSSQVDFYRQVAAALQADDVRRPCRSTPATPCTPWRSSTPPGRAPRAAPRCGWSPPATALRRSRSSPARRRPVAEAQPRRRTSRRSSTALSPSRVTT